MWFKLATAKFTNHLGSMESLSKSYRITYETTGLSGSPALVPYTTLGETIPVEFTFTVKTGYEFKSGSTITCGGSTIFTAGQDYAAGSTFTATANISASVSISGTASAVTPDVPTPDPEEPGTTNYTFTINPDPISATVTLSATGYSTVSGTGSQSINVANGTEVNWNVRADGYTTRTGNWTANGENKTESIVLTASGGGGDSNLMPVDARLDANTVFASNTTSQQWGAWKGTSPVVENDYVKVYCDLTNSLQGIRKAAPDNLTDGQNIKFSFYVKIGEGETLTKNLQFYVAGSKNTVFTGLSTEWKLCEWTVNYDSTVWDRIQISMNTSQESPITLYLKDFSMTVV